MADHPSPKKPWFMTMLGLFLIVTLLALPFIVGPAGKRQMPDLVRFIGHFHPLILHLPIGVFALILLEELGSIFWKRGFETRSTSLFPLFFGALSAIITVIAGFLLYHGHGDEYGGNPLAERHLWGGLFFAVAAITTFICKAWAISSGGSFVVYRVLLFSSVTIMGFTGHDGASMTHGENYLTIYAPEPIRKMMGLPVKQTPGTVSKTQPVYAEIIAPILERCCVECHQESKSKGKFRMDTYERLVKGGKQGPGLVAGNSTESNIIKRIMLPKDDDESMPPEGKKALSDDEISLLKRWIDSGAMKDSH
jgi:uncharacterized membrane protein